MTATRSASLRYDLHLHSTLSDGALTPQALLQGLSEAGLDVVALTDHDLTGGFEPGEHIIAGRPMRLIGAAEISGVHAGKELHLLVYFPAEVPQGFKDFCRGQCIARARRYDAAITQLGLDLPMADPSAHEGARALTRHHLAREMVQKQLVRDTREAFSRFLADRHGKVPHLALSFVEAIRTARAYGGFTSWAHPSVADVDAYVTEFVAAGLQGLESVRPYTSSADRRSYRKRAVKHGLYLTGGSDWHGHNDGRLGLFHVQEAEISDFLDAFLAA